MAQSRSSAVDGTDARRVSSVHAQRQLRQLSLRVNRAIKAPNADAIHDLRVAIRRFTQAVAVCQHYFRSPDLPKNRKRLKKIMTVAGEVRNCDVALKLVSKFRVPHAVHLQAKLKGCREEAEVLLVNDLKKWLDRAMPVKWRAALGAPMAGRQEGIRAFARRALDRIAKDFLKRGNEASSPEASPEGLHHFRIAVKKFRYTLEMFRPVFGSSLNPVVASVRRASALLGNINDCVTVAEMVVGYKGGRQLADRLKKRQHRKTEEFRKFWKEEFSDDERLQSILDQPAKKPAASSRMGHGRRTSVA
jgi:CHAD domain-containing protein